MRTHWSVLWVLVAACQTAPSGRSDAVVWHAPGREPVLAIKDAGEAGMQRPRRAEITVGDAVRESLAVNRTVRSVRLAAAIAVATSQEVLESTALLTRSRFDYISSLYRYNNALSALHRARGADPRTPPSTSMPIPGEKQQKKK